MSKSPMIILVTAVLMQSCNDSFEIANILPETNPIEIDICTTCITDSLVFAYESKLNSDTFFESKQAKYSWFRNVVSWTGYVNKKPEDSEELKDDRIKIFLRAESALEGYNEAAVYVSPLYALSSDQTNEKRIIRHVFYPGKELFGYYKTKEVMNPREVVHCPPSEVNSELFLENYHSILLWLKAMENGRFKLTIVPSTIEGSFVSVSKETQKGRRFKLEEPWMDELLFNSYYIEDLNNALAAPIVFKVKPYAPLETYAVYGKDDRYPLHYALNLEDLIFSISIYSDQINSLNF
jgi:hypothetical protein